uniref:Uncharacterized protein n=1 Tax=Daucus carota subsp. sativus TaxID=79200 RepID=A0A166DBP0_DAUCS
MEAIYPATPPLLLCNSNRRRISPNYINRRLATISTPNFSRALTQLNNLCSISEMDSCELFYSPSSLVVGERRLFHLHSEPEKTPLSLAKQTYLLFYSANFALSHLIRK